MMSQQTIQTRKIRKFSEAQLVDSDDQLAVEEPLEILMQYGSPGSEVQKTVSVTMRTPGNDAALAAGFLFTEGIIRSPSDVKMIVPEPSGPNTVLIILHEGVDPRTLGMERNFYATSSCGVCGKASREALRAVSVFGRPAEELSVPPSLFAGLPEKLRHRQELFERTGGIHASALFDAEGTLHSLAEDVGRHNALDKLVGEAFLAGQLPLSRYLLFLSGRAGFELVQKAYMAGIRLIAAVGAPSSLAAELAEEHGITLIGFLRGKKFNVYSGFERIG